jgi:hypothetical protein
MFAQRRINASGANERIKDPLVARFETRCEGPPPFLLLRRGRGRCSCGSRRGLGTGISTGFADDTGALICAEEGAARFGRVTDPKYISRQFR